MIHRSLLPKQMLYRDGERTSDLNKLREADLFLSEHRWGFPSHRRSCDGCGTMLVYDHGTPLNASEVANDTHAERRYVILPEGSAYQTGKEIAVCGLDIFLQEILPTIANEEGKSTEYEISIRRPFCPRLQTSTRL